MTHRIDIRLPEEIYNELRKQPGTMTHNVCNALQAYLCTNDTQNNQTIVTILQDQIQDLRNDKQLLQKRLDYFLLPWYKRILLPLAR